MRALLSSAPSEHGTIPDGIPGIVPPLDRLPQGCAFAPRCRHAEPQCESGAIALEEVRPGWRVRCIRWLGLARQPEMVS